MLKKFIANGMASVLTLVAVLGVSTNSMWWFYEPDIPRKLQ